MIKPIYLHREFTSIVEAVSVKITPILKAYDSSIQAVHYKYGHPLEIINTISKYTGNTEVFKKYPLVAFFLDSTETVSGQPGVYADYSVHMAIIRECGDPNQTAEERDTTNFIPVLTPIYVELINQIMKRGDLFMWEGEVIPHERTNRYYWGRAGLWKNEANIFHDWVDCIEIERLKLRVKNKIC